MRGLALLIWLLTLAGGLAHESRPGYLELRETAPDTYDVRWKVPARGELRLSIHIHFPDQTRHLVPPAGSFSDGAFIERSQVTRPGGLAGTSLRIDGLESTRTDALIRVTDLEGVTQAFRVTPASPTFTIEKSPSSWNVTVTYLVIGVEHILLGLDHLLFVLALVLLVQGWKKLVGTITAFTLAHSITLAAATLELVRVPGPPVEACIALSIVFVAVEIIRSRQGREGLTERSPWLVAFIFGLLHGLGFAGALSEVGLPPQAIPLALLFFNVGVELGQLAFIGLVLGLGRVIRRCSTIDSATHRGWRVAPYAIGSLAVFWVIDRASAF